MSVQFGPAPCMFCAAPDASFLSGVDEGNSIGPGHACRTCFFRAVEALNAAPDGVCAFCRADGEYGVYVYDGGDAHVWGPCHRTMLTETETVTPFETPDHDGGTP